MLKIWKVTTDQREERLEWLHWRCWDLNWLLNITWASSTTTRSLLSAKAVIDIKAVCAILLVWKAILPLLSLPLSLGKLNEFIVIADSEHWWIFFNTLERTGCHKLPGPFFELLTHFCSRQWTRYDLVILIFGLYFKLGGDNSSCN